MYSKDEKCFEFQLTGLKSAMVVLCLLALGYLGHHYTYYYNPNLDKSIAALESDDPNFIGEALYQIQKLTMGKGYKLIPHILPILKDSRPLPEIVEQKIIREIQSTPGAMYGIGRKMRGSLTLGSTAALTLQSLVILDVQNRRFVGGKAQDQIINYIIENISQENDEFEIANGLAAVRQVHDQRLIPFWFKCLELDSETIKIHALSGLFHYVHDRVHMASRERDKQ